MNSKQRELHLWLSLDYPKAYDVSDSYTSRLVGLDELKHWELAPSNAARVHAAGIEFARQRTDSKAHRACEGRVDKHAPRVA